MLRVLALVAVAALVAGACSKKKTPTTGASSGGTTATKNVKIEFFGALSGDYKLLVIHGFQAAIWAITGWTPRSNVRTTRLSKPSRAPSGDAAS